MYRCSIAELCFLTKVRSDVIIMCVVPVQIWHPDSNKVLDTYAMLDNCFQGGNDWGIGGHWSRSKSNSEDTQWRNFTDNYHGWESEGSRIIGQTKVDKATKSLHQAQELPVDEQEIAVPEKVKR